MKAPDNRSLSSGEKEFRLFVPGGNFFRQETSYKARCMYRKKQRMARGKGEVESRPSLRSHFVERVVKLPMVHVAWDYAANTYSSIKESNRLVNFTLTNAERSVNFVAGQAKPVVMKFEKQIQVVDDFAYKSLGTLEEKVPIITKRPDQIIGDTRKLYEDTVHNKVEDLRKYGNNTVKRITDLSFQTASLFLGESVVNSVISSVDGVLVMTESYIDQILPPGEEEEKAKHDGNHYDYQNNVKKDDHPQHAPVARIAHIASVIPHRIYRITLVKLNGVRATFMEIYNIPDYLLGFAVQNLETVSIYLQRLWEVLNEEGPLNPDDKNVPLKRLLPILRPIFKRLLSLYNSLSSAASKDKVDSNNIGNNVAETRTIIGTARDSVLRMIGLLRLVPAFTPIYLLSLVSWFSKKFEDESQSAERVSKEKNNGVKPEQNNVHPCEGNSENVN